MTEQSKTIAVVGASPFAWLLAGLLASDHSRAVVLISPPLDRHRLRAIPSLSLAPLTRPDTWSLLCRHARPTVRRLARIASGMSERIDLRLQARSAEASLAMSHMHHMAEGFQCPVDRPRRTDDLTVMGLGDVWMFNPTPLLSAAASWLAAANVAMLHTLSGLKLRRDGTATFGTTVLDQVVLADDWAILELLDPEDIAQFARVEKWLGVETAPTRHRRHRAGIDLDTGALFAQSASGSIRAAGRDDDGKGMDRIALALAEDTPARLAARAHFSRLVTHDGAPVLGSPRRARPFVIAGLGVLDLALAPLAAAVIAGDAAAPEAKWAAAHGTNLRQPRREIAEFAPGHLAGGGA